MKKRYQIAMHILCWLIFGSWIFYFQSNRGLTFVKGFDVTIGLTFQLMIFYFNWYVLIPKYLARNRILMYLAIMLTTLAVVALVRSPLDFYIFRELNPTMETLYSSEKLVQYMLGSLVTIFISSALKITGNYIRNERLNKELENQKLMAELGYLKSQVNPHFLFNTLNNIYSLAYKQSPETPDAIMKLSLLMRYMLYESNDNLVCLQKEVDHLHNFIDLQKLRLREQTSIKFDISGNLEGKQIAPMMLMTLVENAFKHGLVSKNEIGIIFNLNVQESFLSFSTVNNISTHKKREYGGIGLENLKRRLNLLYPNRHKLSLEEKEGAFYATLTIYYQNPNPEKL
ncbi:sensor histidine kinase [Pontibacter harenae]|uniref:sensor histidine kinase n=1 Tax=Pontibacter harenae TaxID=2894083 RepID=UPI001E48CF95|nr:sensor histidine kinase [Pontibacter harenae]MCC9167489.1 sensor histidine kinase [Pontibacter harenae]